MSSTLEPHDLRDLLDSTHVGELTIADRPSLSRGDTVADAAAKMREASHGSALVCEDGKLVGIFTERDLLKSLAADDGLSASINDVMTQNPQTATTSDSLTHVMELMDKGGYRRLPVVDETQKPVGIIDVKTLVHFLVEHFPESIYTQASHAHLTARHREGA